MIIFFKHVYCDKSGTILYTKMKSYTTDEIMSLAHRLAGELREKIRKGIYSFGQKLPVERELIRQTGLSRGTVRKALGILEAERLIVRQHGRGAFVADPLHAQSQLPGTSLVAMMVFEREYYFETVIQSASFHAAEQGYVMATGTNSTPELEFQHINAFINIGVDGVIMTPREQTSYVNYQRLIEKNIPVVFMDNILPECEEDCVIVNNYRGTSLAVKHLARLGHRRIAYIGHNQSCDLPCRPERLRGYQDGCRDYGYSVPDEWVIETSMKQAGMHVASFLKKPDRPTAFVTYNDAWAIEVIKAAAQVGLSVPGDLSVVGFDDSVLASHNELPLTTINPQREELGIAAIEMLINKVEKPRKRPKVSLSINPHLVIRKSTDKVPDNI